MANTKRRKVVAHNRVAVSAQGMDGNYLLKLVLYLVVGSFWLKLTLSSGSHVPIPFGLLIGLYVTRKERVEVDRKIEYALLLVAMLVGYFAPYGVYISL